MKLDATSLTFPVALVILAAAASASAQTPETIGYAGFLVDDRGPVDSQVDIEAAIFTDRTAGERLWHWDYGYVDVLNGAFALTLGDREPLPYGLFGGQPLFLELRIDGETLTPRTSLSVAVPYALRARVAEDGEHPQGVWVGTQQVIDEAGNWVGGRAPVDVTDLEARVAILEVELEAVQTQIIPGWTQRFDVVLRELATRVRRLEAVVFARDAE